jgi:putative membrane protein
MITNRIFRRVLLGSAAALLTALPALAQSPGGSMPSQQQPSTNPNPPNMTGPGAYPGTAATPDQMGDRDFVTKALEGGKTEVELGQLAQQKSQSQDVKQFAQKMVSDHSQMGEKWFEPMAKQLNISEPKGPSKKDKKLIARLQGLSGSDFDNEYIKAMVKDHQDDLKEFQSEAKSTQDPNVKQVAERGSQIIQLHLNLIEQVAKNHNVPVEGKEVSSNN